MREPEVVRFSQTLRDLMDRFEQRYRVGVRRDEPGERHVAAVIEDNRRLGAAWRVLADSTDSTDCGVAKEADQSDARCELVAEVGRNRRGESTHFDRLARRRVNAEVRGAVSAGAEGPQ